MWTAAARFLPHGWQTDSPFFHFFGKDVSVLERVRLKNIIILILAMLNCYLLGSLAVQRLQAENAFKLR